MSGKFGDQVDEYANVSAQRLDRAFNVHIDHPVEHGNAGDAVRGADGHSANDPREFTPHTPNKPGRDAQRDKRSVR